VPENVIAVALILPDLTRSVAEEHLSELEKLIETAGGTVVDRVFAKRPRPDPATYVGSGKAEQIGFFETVLGDPSNTLRRIEAFRRITAGDLRRVARRYLVDSERTVLHVLPERAEAALGAAQ